MSGRNDGLSWALSWSIPMLMSFWFYGCDLWIAGSHKTGYRVVIETQEIPYSLVRDIEERLILRGYTVGFKERLLRQHGIERFPDEVYTFLEKTWRTDKGYMVEVFLSYVKDEPNGMARWPRITVGNWIQGGVAADVTQEIDITSQWIFEELSRRVEKDRVTLRRSGRIAEQSGNRTQ